MAGVFAYAFAYLGFRELKSLPGAHPAYQVTYPSFPHRQTRSTPAPALMGHGHRSFRLLGVTVIRGPDTPWYFHLFLPLEVVELQLRTSFQ